MADLQTNLNVPPFYDDYDEDKQYYRILFRPGTAVQARELTQLQTMLQKQISRFGDSVYKDGTIVEGCTFSQYPNIDQVKFKDSNSSTMDFGLLTVNYSDDVANTTYDIGKSYVLVSNTTGLRALVFRAYQGAESAVNSGSLETNRAYVFYLNSGNNAGIEVKKFSTSSEQIDVYNETQSHVGPLVPSKRIGSIYTLTSNSTVNALGVGYGIHVGAGVIYQKGFFLKTLPTNIVIKENSSNAAGIKVGFNTAEYIIKPAADESLYDNSTGSTNYSAPGAYRLKLVPSPIHYDSTNTQITIPDSFLTILDFEGGTGRPVISKEYDLVLSKIGKSMSDRTFESSGNFAVRPFQIDVSAHESNTQSFYYNVSPGIAYVDGQRIEYQSPKKIEVARAVTTTSANNNAITLNMGNYIKVRNLAGTLNIDGLQEIQFLSANQAILSNNQGASSIVGGAVAVGNANIRAITYIPGSGMKGTANATYQVYFYNVRMNPGASFASNAKSIYVASGSYGPVFGDIVANTADGKIEVFGQDNRTFVYPLGVPGVRRLTTNTGVNSTQVVYRQTIQADLVPGAAGTGGVPPGIGTSSATFTMPSPDLSYFGGSAALSETNKNYVNVTLASNAFSANIASDVTIQSNTGGFTVIQSSAVQIGNPSFNYLPVGTGVLISNTTGSPTYHTVVSYPNINQVRLVGESTAGGTSIFAKKFLKAGTQFDIALGAADITPAVNRQSVTASFKTFFPDSNGYKVLLQMPITRNTAQPTPKVVRKNTFVKIDCSTAGTTGPWALGWPDVYKVANVHVGATYSTTNTDRSGWFELDTGQQDNMYNIAKLRLKPQYAGSLTSASRLLVKMNHLTPNATSTAALFFSEDSYPIDDANTANTSAIATAEIPLYTTDKGLIYDLRNSIDVRPYVANTAVLATTDTAATVNPSANSSTFFTAISGVGAVSLTGPVSIEPDSNMNYNIEYYLPRRDLVFVNGDGSLSVKKGEPAADPKLPAINKTGLKIAEIYVPPYPSLTFKEAE
jgi:hypothetical protein